MSSPELVPLLFAVLFVLVLVGTGVAVARHRTRRGQPRAAFGAEPYQAVALSPARHDAGPAPVEPDQQHRELALQPLPDAERQRYLAAWDGVQGRFAHAPVLALSEADALLTRLLADRGMPTGDPRTPAGALSAQHTHVLEAFRAGHAIEQRNSTQRADAEEVRRGMLHFQLVFEALVGEGGGAPSPRTSQKVSQRGNR